MKRFICIPLMCLFLGLSFCCQVVNKTSIADANEITEFIVEPGENWLGRMKVFIFSVQKTPQMVAWIEDENGRYISTITVTNRSSRQNWRSAPKEGRPEALPVWNRRQQNNQTHDNLDAVSSATQKGSVEAKIDTGALADGNTYNVYFEINHSFDYNPHWTKENSGVNGQPSLVYHAQFIAGQTGRISFILIGHGSVDGSDGNITGGLENFTSALSIVKNAYITVK